VNSRTASWPRPGRAVLAGALIGVLLAAVPAWAFIAEAHTSHLWYHGMAGTDDGKGNVHPFLTSTDGAHRQASASFRHCINGMHWPQAEYIHSHVHMTDEGVWYRYAEAHLGSQQTGMGHHIHFRC
jgi:hypothetical protein